MSWRKVQLLVAGVLVCIYALAVLAYVRSTPDIGIRCAFKPVVMRVHSSDQQDLPELGDIITQVGRYRFPPENQLQLPAQVALLRELIELNNSTVSDLASPEASARQSGDRWVLEDRTGAPLFTETADGAKFVLVQFRHPDEAGVHAVSCRLGWLPITDLGPSILWFFLKLGLFLVGALVFWKRPTDNSAALFFLLCIVTLGAYMGGYHWARIVTKPVLLLGFMVCAVLLPAVSLHFFVHFPRPKTWVQRHPRVSLLAIYGVPLAFLALLGYSYIHFQWIRLAEPETLAPAWDRFRIQINVYMAIAVLWYLASVVSLVRSLRSTQDLTERNQVKCILYAALMALVPIGYTLYLIFWQPEEFGAGEATWWMFTASVFFTVAFVVSMTRYRLMQLDQLLSSGMVYFLISFAALVVYYGVVFVGMLLSGVIGEPSVGQAISVSTTALVLVVILDVARSRIKKALDRRFFREKHQLDRTLRRMGQAIEQLVDPPTLARRLLQASVELLNASRGAVYLRDGSPPLFRLVDTHGFPAPPLGELSLGCPLVEILQTRRALTIGREEAVNPAQRQLRFLGGEVAYALAHENRLLAFLVLGPKDIGAYGTDDLNLLAAFAQLTALALESAIGHSTIEMLNRDLQAKVEKISEQQRRILALQSQLMKGVGSRQPVKSNSTATEFTSQANTPPLLADANGTIVGSSLAMRQVLEMVRKASASLSAVLIRGESGTGKELLARALHDNSPRAAKPYVKVHCAALSPGLLESELFGHVKGAFTSAHRDKVGRFEMANGGTLFLDEIGDINLEVQTKLLRVLEEKTFERVGSSEPLQVDVRIIAATHQNLEILCSQGRFREDLYYRLMVIDLTVPPLRDRREDIPELAQHFLRVYSERCGKGVTQIDDDALAVLKGHRWPGNIRELEHVIERAVVVAEGPAVTVAELSQELVKASNGHHEPALANGADKGHGDGSAGMAGGTEHVERARRNQKERERLVRALAAAGGNKAEAARALGLARSTLVSRLKKHGLS
jgi:transcriptional regulator with GAF, ATPase, and Fis domain